MEFGTGKSQYSLFQKIVVNLLLIVCFAFLLFPVYWVVTMAFKSHEDILVWPPKFLFKPSLENFKNITTAVRVARVGAVSTDFLKGFVNSLIITVSAMLLSLITGIPASYALGRFRFKGKDDIAFTFLSFRFAPELLVIIPIYLIFQQIGLYDTYIGLIWVYQLITMPMVIWILMSYFEEISIELEQASLVDGFPPLRTFWRIILPMAKPGIAAASLLAFIYAWNNFIFALILGSSKVQPVTVSALKFITAEKLRYGDIAAACVLAAIPIFLLSVYAQRYMVRGLSLGAVKQ
ncbi:sugar ABC transporter permease [candidate division KSB3 bacterium]|uniref:Sugar ABC transporter permease n=1 Tax=candidate division KSB3 bacterium TaxID=2044937 RepID=A0A2G6KHD0_9BACT|nr:MAG: sugar ABC transporter permease [candidate division KSB3 bacterium]